MSKLVRDLNDLEVISLVDGLRGETVVVFTAVGCIPCGHFEPELRQVAEAFERVLRFSRVEITENPSAVRWLDINDVPTTVLYRDGKEVQRWVGPYNAAALKERICRAAKLSK